MASKNVLVISSDRSLKAQIIEWADPHAPFTYVGVVKSLEAAFALGKNTTIEVVVIDCKTASQICTLNYFCIRSYLPDTSIVICMHESLDRNSLLAILSNRATPLPKLGFSGAIEANGTTSKNAYPIDKLTLSERIIIPFIVEGLSNAGIGARVGLSTKTIKNRISLILNKLHLQNRTQLAIWAWTQASTQLGASTENQSKMHRSDNSRG